MGWAERDGRWLVGQTPMLSGGIAMGAEPRHARGADYRREGYILFFQVETSPLKFQLHRPSPLLEYYFVATPP